MRRIAGECDHPGRTRDAQGRLVRALCPQLLAPY